MIDVVKRVAETIFIPFSVGGGIRTVEDMRDVLLAGAEKIAQAMQASRNTAAVKAQANTQSSQTSSVLSMIRGQGGQVNLMA